MGSMKKKTLNGPLRWVPPSYHLTSSFVCQGTGRQLLTVQGLPFVSDPPKSPPICLPFHPPFFSTASMVASYFGSWTLPLALSQFWPWFCRDTHKKHPACSFFKPCIAPLHVPLTSPYRPLQNPLNYAAASLTLSVAYRICSRWFELILMFKTWIEELVFASTN